MIPEILEELLRHKTRTREQLMKSLWMHIKNYKELDWILRDFKEKHFIEEKSDGVFYVPELVRAEYEKLMGKK